MDLYILRHGKAEPAAPGGCDADRQLTKKGRDDILVVARFLAAQGTRYDLIAASPLARAQETAAIVAGVLEVPEAVRTWDVLVPGGDPDTVCREVSRHEQCGAVLLVGHEPLLSSLVGRIISGGDGAAVVMAKGGLAKVRDFSFAKHPAGELHWLLTAKQVARFT